MHSKTQWIFLFLLASNLTFGQSEYDPYDPFHHVFEGMFDVGAPMYIPENTPPAPPVPLDGGLVALIAAGGAMAYKKYQGKKGKEPR